MGKPNEIGQYRLTTPVEYRTVTGDRYAVSPCPAWSVFDRRINARPEPSSRNLKSPQLKATSSLRRPMPPPIHANQSASRRKATRILTSSDPELYPCCSPTHPSSLPYLTI